MSSRPQALPQSRWHRLFQGAIAQIPFAACWIETIAVELALPESRTFAMQVCLEELMSNIVQYGKPSPPPIESVNPLLISVTVEALPDRTTMTIEDNGRPFNVARAPAKAIDQPLDQLQPGGLGIYLIKNFASTLRYSRTESGNRVVVEFKD